MHGSSCTRIARPKYRRVRKRISSRKSYRRLNQIADRPEISLDSRCHRRSSSQRIVTFHEIVVREVQGNRCLKVLFLLAESVSQTGQAPHVKAGRTIQPLSVTRRSQTQVWTA